MAIDNLNYYSAWLPAGQQTDRYSSQPWCLRSKNLDIFSSSKSVKATAWSTPTTTDADVIKQDWKLLLKTDGKVYERTANWDVLVVDPSINFPVYQVDYWSGTENAQWGTVQDLVAKYEWDSLRAFTVFTDRATYTWSDTKYVPWKSFSTGNFTLQSSIYNHWYEFRQHSVSSSWYVALHIDKAPFSTIPIKVYAINRDSDDTTINLDKIILYKAASYKYDAQGDDMIPYGTTTQDISVTWDITQWISIDLPIFPTPNWLRVAYLYFTFTKKEWASTYWWQNWRLYVDINGWPIDYRRIDGTSDWDYDEYYTYLPVRERKLVSVWDYGYSQSYWIKGTSFQPLYKWTWSWMETNGMKKVVYDLVTDMWWETDVSMDIIWLIIWNEQVYMIWNMNWNWYIIPCDLSWWRWTPYIAYGCTFTGVANIDYLMYLVWDDRGISQLRAYNWQELVKVIWWNKESNTNDLIDIEEQYKFDWKIVKYRWNLILSTSDNRLFEYGQTYGGKGWAFVHEIPWTITNLKADWNDLTVEYSVTSGWTTTKYLTTYQDDTPIKKYNTERIAEYPIVIWNHLLEKEESDLYASYILPSSACSLEFWGMANHYHFWTFTSSDSYTFSTEASYKMKWCTGNYALKFIEKNDNQYTFRLEWDLPVHTTNNMKITDTEWTELITYSDFNHFRKIGEITTTEYQEWEFRFHNLNNKLELPKSHSLQIMVKGKGNQNYTPELFALDLVANQRDRW